jgi:hypothetical protein
MIQILRVPGLGRRLIQFIRKILSDLRLEECRADLRFGCGDAADTGIAFAWSLPVLFAVNSRSRCAVHLEPDFTDLTLRGNGHGTIRVIPATVIREVAFLGLSRPVWTVAITMLRRRWKRRASS